VTSWENFLHLYGDIVSTPSIRTTVVGSYPVPDWLVALPSQQALIDATRVVFQIQELAGIDVVADGELYRWDVNHPDTNGMIEYFIRPMDGIRSRITRKDVEEFRSLEGMGFRAAPAGVVEGPIDEGTMSLGEDYRRARACTSHPMKFTLTGPHMLAKTLMDHHYGSRESLALGLAEALARQVRELDPDVIQIDEANITGHPDEAEWAAAAINVMLDAAVLPKEKGVHMCFGNYGGQSIQRG
jgi:5-methyltetrahydropteroyltriglutamate--homocysteine methyltransferase